MQLVTFWWILTIACLVWYSTVTVYVAVRAVWDIRGMLSRLRSIRDAQETADADESPG